MTSTKRSGCCLLSQTSTILLLYEREILWKRDERQKGRVLLPRQGMLARMHAPTRGQGNLARIAHRAAVPPFQTANYHLIPSTKPTPEDGAVAGCLSRGRELSHGAVPPPPRVMMTTEDIHGFRVPRNSGGRPAFADSSAINQCSWPTAQNPPAETGGHVRLRPRIFPRTVP